MAHAIHGYNGPCKNVHGHSYELHVTAGPNHYDDDYIPAPGLVIDFKEIKSIVNNTIIQKLDHKLVLSTGFLQKHPEFSALENLVTWEAEPTAENMLVYIRKSLAEKFPKDIVLLRLKLYETKDSYAEWIKDNTFNRY